MTTPADLAASHAHGGPYFGYVQIAETHAPPFVMFSNGGDCTVSAKYLRDGAFEPTSLRIWSQLAREATSIFDIGAHAGIYSLMAARLRPDLQIHAFEPNPDVYARLMVNICANGIANIVPHRSGIGPVEGHFHRVWVNKRFGALSSGSKFLDAEFIKGDVSSVVARTTRFDAATAKVDLGARPLIKIDVEGLEQAVFESMGDVLAASRPDIILEAFQADQCAALTALTRPLGYSYYMIDEAAVRVMPLDALRPAPLDHMNQLLTTRPFSLAKIP